MKDRKRKLSVCSIGRDGQRIDLEIKIHEALNEMMIIVTDSPNHDKNASDLSPAMLSRKCDMDYNSFDKSRSSLDPLFIIELTKSVKNAKSNMNKFKSQNMKDLYFIINAITDDVDFISVSKSEYIAHSPNVLALTQDGYKLYFSSIESDWTRVLALLMAEGALRDLIQIHH
jgi:hypothetical protein